MIRLKNKFYNDYFQTQLTSIIIVLLFTKYKNIRLIFLNNFYD